MKLAMTVTDPAHPEKELLTAGYALDALLLNRLKGVGITVLYVAYPDLSDMDRHLAPYLNPARREIYQHIKDTITGIQGNSRPSVSFADYYAATRSLVSSLFRQGKHPVYLEEMIGGLGADGVRHSAAVAHLSMVMGIRLEQYIVKQRKLPPDHAREIVNLGVAGMLHDIGKTQIPARLRHHTCLNEPKDPADIAAWQAHASWSYDIVRNGVEASAAAAVLHHHQHFDGSGFPKMFVRRGSVAERVEGLGIHVFGRILLAADLYERLTVAPNGRRRSTVQILHLMRTTYAGRVDPQIMRVLPSIIPPYPARRDAEDVGRHARRRRRIPPARTVLPDGAPAESRALDVDRRAVQHPPRRGPFDRFGLRHLHERRPSSGVLRGREHRPPGNRRRRNSGLIRSPPPLQ